MPKKFKYYDIRHMLKEFPDAHYYMCIGERSNGKTYSSMDYCIENFARDGEQFAYVRRYGEDIKIAQMSELFSGHIKNDRISQLTHGEWTTIVFERKKFYFARYDEGEKIVKSPIPCGFVFDLSGMEHYKSVAFPDITTIVFDEFMSRRGYLPNEFELFQNLLSTIIRLRNNVKIFMLANTVNKYCPYFAEMGLNHVKEQKQGTIDIYRYGESGLQVAVEYCESATNKGGKASDVYFSFDNPRLQMITQGSWEINAYPRLPFKPRPKDVIFEFFVHFDNEYVHGEVLKAPDNGGYVLFFHPKTTEIKNPDKDWVYTDYPSCRLNYRMQLTKQGDYLSRKIMSMFRENRVFYATNECGEIIRNYLMWCNTYSVTN